MKPVQSISMRDFLESGSLGSVKLGDTVEKLRELWGEPSDQGGRKKGGRYGIWKYGDVEFHLDDDFRTIRLIFCDTYGSLSLGETVALDPWFFTAHPSLEEVKEELVAAEFAIRQERPVMPESQRVALR